MSEYSREQTTLSIELAKLTEDARTTQEKIHAVIKAGRQEDMSWVKIGAALGTSGQSAWERYGLTYKQQSERSALRNAARYGSQGVLDIMQAMSDVPDSGNVTSEGQGDKQA